MSNTLFTPEELEALKVIDAEIDATPMTAAEYAALKKIEDLLFPEKAIEREKRRDTRDTYYLAHRDEILAKYREYYEAHKEEIAARKAQWYLENKEAIAAQQKEYRIRTGRARSDEERAAAKAATKDRREREYIERMAKKNGISPEEYAARLEAKRARRKLPPEKRRRAYYLEHCDEIAAKQKAYRCAKKGLTVEEYDTQREAARAAKAAAKAAPALTVIETKKPTVSRRGYGWLVPQGQLAVAAM